MRGGGHGGSGDTTGHYLPKLSQTPVKWGKELVLRTVMFLSHRWQKYCKPSR